MTDARRALPSVGVLLESGGLKSVLAHYPRSVVVAAIRDAIAHARAGASAPESPDEWASAVAARVAEATRPTLRPVINATGVILHTNLGRAPLAEEALAAIAAAARGYSTLEYDIDTGGRGSRHAHCQSLLAELTGAEDALIVNNCAAALLLALSALADGKDAIVSRGELIEIGGSFRIPDIMAESGAALVEVGTTNRTHADDYIRACGERTGAIVKIHRSNFTVEGFVSEVPIERLAPIAAERDIPVIFDLGSGLVHSLADAGLKGEPLVSEGVASGAALVLFSADKLLGGPQAGIIVGKRSAVSRLRAHPLARAMRVDKLTISALAATLALYREPELARERIPILKMLTATPEEIGSRARHVAAALRARGVEAETLETIATIGGGAFPSSRIASCAVALGGPVETLEQRLRTGTPHVVGRILEGRLLLDMRTVMPSDVDVLIEAVLLASA